MNSGNFLNAVKQKKIAFLGAGISQLKAIKFARAAGSHCITIDNQPDNPGHQLAHKSFITDTLDTNDVLRICQSEKVDGILAFAAQAGTMTAARVANELGLPGNSAQVIDLMNDKFLTRQFMQKKKIQHPEFIQLQKEIPVSQIPAHLTWPLVIKPVDNAGSLGVSVVSVPEEWQKAQEIAFANSPKRECIVEEYIDGPQLHGDAWIQDGNIAFICLGDHILEDTLVKATIYPSQLPSPIVRAAEQQVDLFIRKSGFQTGGINIEVRWSHAHQKAFIIEINPRNGGNGTSDAVEAISGFSFSHTAVLAALGEKNPIRYSPKEARHTANLLVSSVHEGAFARLEIKDDLQKCILSNLPYLHTGMDIHVRPYKRKVIGALVLGADDYDSLSTICGHPELYYTVIRTNEND